MYRSQKSFHFRNDFLIYPFRLAISSVFFDVVELSLTKSSPATQKDLQHDCIEYQ